MNLEEKEKKDRLSAGLISLGLHAGLLLLFFFLMAWQEPDPPLPSYGIELNLGFSTVGSGENPSEVPTTAEPTPETEESREASPNQEANPAQEALDNLDTENSPESEENSPAEPSPAPQQGKSPTEKPNGASSQGNDTNKKGDKGHEDGKIDNRALYGTPGSGTGAALDMTGWVWDYKPTPDDTSDESGRIVFEVKIDENGEIISVRTLEKTVSPTVEKVYKKEVEKLTFSRTADNAIAASTSTGKITFTIKSR